MKKAILKYKKKRKKINSKITFSALNQNQKNIRNKKN